ncbi:MAG: hypothetical protein ACTTH5_07360, partial [Wolinella sp.]
EYADFKAEFTYGIFQIDEEINIKIQSGIKPNGEPNMVFADGELNNMLKGFKKAVKRYYLENLVEIMFKYELLK